MACLQLVLEGQLQGDFYGGGAVIGKVKLIQAGGHIFNLLLAELDGWLMGKVYENNMLQLVDLFFDGLVNLRIAVT